METIHWQSLAAALVTIAIAATIRTYSARRDPQEPPFVPTDIPLFGHLIHLFRQGAQYFSRLDERYHYGLYALPVFGNRMYIVNSPEWALAMHRCKTLSFNALVLQAYSKVFGFDQRTMEIVKKNANNEAGDCSGVLLDQHDMMFTTFVRHIDELNANFIGCFAPHINDLALDKQVQTTGLWFWLRHHFSIASTESLYGPKSPLTDDPTLVEDTWLLDDSIDKLFTVPFPSLFARKPYLARKHLADAFIDYVKKDAYIEASEIVQLRVEMNLRHGFTKEMHGKGEISMLFATLINTVPVVFWLLSYILADPQLFAEIRGEIDQCVTAIDDGRKCIINVGKLKTHCPLLNSAMRENERISATLNINRYVLDDTQITNTHTGETYLLKKGNMVTVAANVLHFRPDIWGEDAATFNARRFLPTVEKAEPGKLVDPAATFRDAEGKLHSGAFRTFGGGNNVCPGRHFAATEMLKVVSLFVAGFEVEMPDGTQYSPPPYEKMKMIAGAHKPARDVDVKVRRRQGYESVEWGCEM